MVIKITVTFVGFQNAGKSAITDALPQGHCTQTSAKPCTSSVFRFLAHELSDDDATNDLKSMQDMVRSENKKRGGGASEVQEVTPISVCLRAPPCKSMHPDVQLEIMDLLGIDEALGVDSPVIKFVEANWESFGCVAVVFDVLAAKLESHLKILEVLKAINVNKSVPTIIVGNKADWLSDEGIEENVNQIKNFINTACAAAETGPKFMRLSARAALHARCALGLKLDEFKSGHGSQLDRIGELMMNFQWSAMENEHQKLTSVHKALTNNCDGWMRSSNFDELCSMLDATVGGDRQPLILKQLLEAKLKKLKSGKLGWEKDSCAISEDLGKIGSPAHDWSTIMSFFWKQFKDHVDRARQKFERSCEFAELARTFQLIQDVSATLKPEQDRIQDECYEVTCCHFFGTIQKKHSEFLSSNEQLRKKEAEGKKQAVGEQDADASHKARQRVDERDAISSQAAKKQK